MIAIGLFVRGHRRRQESAGARCGGDRALATIGCDRRVRRGVLPPRACGAAAHVIGVRRPERKAAGNRRQPLESPAADIPGATSHQLAVNVFVHPHAGIGYAYVTNRMSTTLPFFPAVRARCVALAAAAESARSAATAIARPPALAISATSASAASACTA